MSSIIMSIICIVARSHIDSSMYRSDTKKLVVIDPVQRVICAHFILFMYGHDKLVVSYIDIYISSVSRSNSCAHLTAVLPTWAINKT